MILVTWVVINTFIVGCEWPINADEFGRSSGIVSVPSVACYEETRENMEKKFMDIPAGTVLLLLYRFE